MHSGKATSNFTLVESENEHFTLLPIINLVSLAQSSITFSTWKALDWSSRVQYKLIFS